MSDWHDEFTEPMHDTPADKEPLIVAMEAAGYAYDGLESTNDNLPKVKKLSIEYAEILTAKKQAYAEYRQVKNEAQELLIAQRNIASLYDAERKEEEQKRQKEDQIH